MDMNMVDAQQTRRKLDRLVGYPLSDLIMRAIPGAMSAGRVQSVVCKMIVDTQKARDKFFEDGADSFFRVKGSFLVSKTELKASLYELTSKKQNGNGEEKDEYFDADEDGAVEEQGETKRSRRQPCQLAKNEKDPKTVEKFIENCKRSSWKVTDVRNMESIRHPAPPFQTSSIQSEAASKLGFPAKKTMNICQQLYTRAAITYHRTDSIILSQQALDAIGDLVPKKYGKEYYKLRSYNNKSGESSQAAHEACRPVDCKIAELDNSFSSDEQRLYNLIWKRTVASQMSSAVFDVRELDIVGSKLDDKHLFMTRAERCKFDGFLAVYNYSDKTEDDESTSAMSKDFRVKVGASCDRLDVEARQSYSTPPAMYTESTLVKAMRKASIARPATTAPTIQKIIDRKYVEVADLDGEKMDSLAILLDRKDRINRESTEVFVGKEKKRYVPTTLGTRVVDFLENKFPQIMDIGFTAEMERQLDDIADGKLRSVDVLKKFWKWFEPEYEKVKKRIKEDKLARGDEPEYDRKLGKDRERGEIYAKLSRYGPTVFYIDKETKKARYAKIPSNMKLEKITFEEALKLLSYPKLIGTKGDKDVWIKRGPYGYYLERDGLRAPIPEGADPEDIDLKQAVELIKDAAKKREEKYLYEFSTDKAEYAVMRGEKGNFVMIRRKDKKGEVQKKGVTFVGIGERDPKSITEEIVEELLKEKGERRGKGRGSKRGAGQTFAESGSADGGQSGGRGRGGHKSGKASGGGYGGGSSKRAVGSSRGRGSKAGGSSSKRGHRGAVKSRSGGGGSGSKSRSGGGGGSSSTTKSRGRATKSRGRGSR
jgi:DNA topoisomerase-1